MRTSEAKSPDAEDAPKTTKIGVLAPMSIVLFIALTLVGTYYVRKGREPANPPALTAEERNKDLVSVAVVDGMDWITISHTTALLRTHDIPGLAEGSVIYGISVPAAQYEQAWRLLRADREKRGYWMDLRGEKKSDYADRLAWMTSEVRAPYREVIARKGFEDGTPLGVILREEHLTNLVPRFPCLYRLTTASQEQLSDDGRMHTACWAVVELTASPDNDALGARYRYQAHYVEGGWQAVFQGGSRY